MIDDPFTDLYKANKRKKIVYVAAMMISLIISILMFVALACFQEKRSMFIENVLLIFCYILLPFMYIWTLINLRKAMKGLLVNQIDTERRSVLIQFSFFLISYLTRLPFDITELFILNSLGGSNFAW